MIIDGLEYVKCNECGRVCLKLEMTDDCRMCKDCYIKWLEAQYGELRKKTNKLISKIENLQAYKTLYRQNTCKKRFFVSTNPNAETSPAMPCYTDRNCAECPRYSAAESK